MKKTVFIKNAVIMTATGIILRLLGIVFKVWLAAKIGAEGIGLYHLVFSVYVLASSFATAGIPTAVTRKVTDELATGTTDGVYRVMRRAMSLTIFVSLFSFLVVFFGAKIIAVRFLYDARAESALKILAFSLPFMGISSVLKGYFIARRNVSPNSFAQILEQAVRIALCFYIVGKVGSKGLSYTCTAVLFCDTLAEICSLLYMAIRFKIDNKKLPDNNATTPKDGILKDLIRISLPITSARYFTSLLRTWENLLVPKTLVKYGLQYSTALSSFGAIKGMALPVLFFPSSVLNAFSTLLIPEMSEALAKNRPYVIKSAVRRAISITWFIGVLFAVIFFFIGEKAGLFIYKDTTCANLIKLLSPIVPFMYLDSISDGILKGLDKQGYTFKISVIDNVLRIILIALIVPHFGMSGFVLIMYISNMLTACLNVGKLLKISSVKLKFFKEIIAPIGSAICLCLFFKQMLSFLGNGLPFLIVFSVCSCISYLLLLVAFKIVDINDYI